MQPEVTGIDWRGPALVSAALLLLALRWWNQQAASPVLGIIHRWARWLFVAVSWAVMAHAFDFNDRPFAANFAIGFLGWGLLETLGNWVAISALSQSPQPLFPVFSRSPAGEEWPVHRRFHPLRLWLRREKFQHAASLIAELVGDIQLRTLVFEDPTRTVRAQVLFLPQPGANLTVCFSLASVTASGERIVTDNLFIPFGGFYPDNYYIERRPWIRSIARLFTLHRRRAGSLGSPLVAWDTDPVSDLNEQQRQLERVNTELGFLMPRDLRDEFGKISQEGRFRVWKEVWLLNYLGIAGSYRD